MASSSSFNFDPRVPSAAGSHTPPRANYGMPLDAKSVDMKPLHINRSLPPSTGFRPVQHSQPAPQILNAKADPEAADTRYDFVAFSVMPQELPMGPPQVDQKFHAEFPELYRDDAAACDASAGSKRKRTGRPRKEHPKRRKRPDRPTRLSTAKPVKANVYFDIWTVIFTQTDPRLLFDLRNMCHDFRNILSYESTWREARQNKYPESPTPPESITESQYMDLIECSGCMKCGKGDARKPYWAFLRRWCKDCFRKETDTIKPEHGLGPVFDDRLLDCIPFATVDSWSVYEHAGDDFGANRVRSGHGRKVVHRHSDLGRIVKEYRAFTDAEVSELASEEEKAQKITEWLAMKKAANQAFLAHVRTVEDWERRLQQSKLTGNKLLRKERADYFKARALELDPPLHPAALELIPEYDKSINISRTHTKRTWDVLKPKVEASRAEAEAWIRIGEPFVSGDLRVLSEAKRHKAQYAEIDGILLNNADHALRTFMLEECTMPTWKSDPSEQDPEFLADVVIRGLQAIHTRLFHIAAGMQNPYPSQLFPHTHQTPLPLTIEDAINIYERRMCHSEFLPQLSSDLRIFRCPGCKRKDVNQMFTFNDLLTHVSTAHTKLLGDFFEFRRAVTSKYFRAWIAVRWHHNLPMIGPQHVPTGNWEPHNPNWYPKIRAGPRNEVPAKKRRPNLAADPNTSNMMLHMS